MSDPVMIHFGRGEYVVDIGFDVYGTPMMSFCLANNRGPVGATATDADTGKAVAVIAFRGGGLEAFDALAEQVQTLRAAFIARTKKVDA